MKRSPPPFGPQPADPSTRPTIERALGFILVLFFWLVAAATIAAPAEAASPTGPPDALTAQAEALRTTGIALGAGLAIALSVIGAGYAVARIGAAALGAAAEKPELLIRSLLFVALAEGLAVLGFAISMMLVQKI